MSENRRLGQPYKKLGEKLKGLRVHLKQTIAEVSGAVEIDTATYELIERGVQRPAEDILALLISYFEIKEDDATQIWQLAGYEENKPTMTQQNTYELTQPLAMIMPIDQRVVYTDMVHVSINNYGVIINFMQGAGQNAQSINVARVGMSKEHAISVLDVLKQTLSQGQKQQKTLSDGNQQKEISDKQKSNDTPDSNKRK